MEKLSPKAKEIFEYIVRHKEKEGVSPSVREIGKGVGLKSSSSVHSHLMKLYMNGYIEMKENSPRTIKIIKKTKENSTANDDTPLANMIDKIINVGQTLDKEQLQDILKKMDVTTVKNIYDVMITKKE